VSSVTARAPAKMNLALRVGPPGADGYHPVATVYHAVSLYEEVTVAPAEALVVEVTGPGVEGVPTDATNLAARAVELLARHVSRPPAVRIRITKGVPVAGGMAGGSADAAAALVACDALWGTRIGRGGLAGLAARLGSDVPFCLAGGTALGAGRGERLTPVLVRGRAHWVFALAFGGLSTPDVYARLDRLRGDHEVHRPAVDDAVVAALAAGDLPALGAALVNDLQPAAISLHSGLRATLASGREAGALGAVVSGSGPTCAFLARDEEHALDLAVTLSASGTCRTVARAHGPVAGATVIAPQ
jgi:4-diphosphocytidyl-2-C-methyl-D-erythritol kinase